eukprot:gene19280-21206_t
MNNNTSATLRIEDGLGNLDRILPNKSNSFNLGRRGSRASNFARRGSNLSSISSYSNNISRSPLLLDVSDKEWFLAASQCHTGKLKELHSVDASFINKKDFFTTALHWASKQGKSELVHWLCDCAADVNLKSGYTALHVAVMNEQATIVDILISDYDANINIRDHSGRKAAYYTQSSTPNWMQRALRANQPVDMNRLDPLSPCGFVEGRNFNLTTMHSRPISRSLGSFNYEAGAEEEQRPGSDHKDHGGARNRAKSLMQSFRKLRHKDKTNRSKNSREKLRAEDHSKSMPEVCDTPRSRKKMLQIEHPHDFHGAIKDERKCKHKNGDINANRNTDIKRKGINARDDGKTSKNDTNGLSQQNGRTHKRVYSPDSIDTTRNTSVNKDNEKGISPSSTPEISSPIRRPNSAPTKTMHSTGQITKSRSNCELKENNYNGPLCEASKKQWPVSTFV